MSEMIERITKAVRNAREMSLCGLCDRDYRRTRCSCEEIARAAIEAMREPSTAMRTAAVEEFRRQDVVLDQDDSEPISLVGIYTAMISAALQPATDTGEAK
jgi:hypothetical protein